MNFCSNYLSNLKTSKGYCCSLPSSQLALNGYVSGRPEIHQTRASHVLCRLFCKSVKKIWKHGLAPFFKFVWQRRCSISFYLVSTIKKLAVKNFLYLLYFSIGVCSFKVEWILKLNDNRKIFRWFCENFQQTNLL